MYASPPTSPEAGHTDAEKEKRDVVMSDQDYAPLSTQREEHDAPAERCQREQSATDEGPRPFSQQSIKNTQLRTPSPTISATSAPSVVSRKNPRSYISPLDSILTTSPDAQAWDFSKIPNPTRYPSALFQANSRYKGTQQSDRQIYKVSVTILTVDMDACTTTGYLQICDLTADHPTLTTFFTGEIIGGPSQKYSFRTTTPAWGASDKTDMTHWARFPAWRSLSAQAKQDLNFTHPSDNSPWWQQENIFMRWKEHFLVPDHKLKSIQGASFEGFYYICLNQVEGRISGIYFHSKSEK
jgi:glucose-induced degradation protein 4